MLHYKYSPLPRGLKNKLQALEKKFPIYLQKIRNLPFAKLPWEHTDELKKIKLPKSINTICVIGMGGSSLGIKTLIDAFPGFYNMTFIDNVEPDFVQAFFKPITNKGQKREIFYIFISKSGETIEVLSLANIILTAQKGRNALIITDRPRSSLSKLAKKWKIPLVPGLEKVPGRFSVLSVSSLLPFTLAQSSRMRTAALDLLAGARRASFKQAYKLACIQYLHFLSGKNITVMFPYVERLDRFVDWYIQLLAESIGKSKKIGITPVKAIGARDQHSQLQLFLHGPQDKFFIFLKQEQWQVNRKISGKQYGLADLFNAEYKGVIKAFLKKKNPFVEISFPQVMPTDLGELFFFFELEVALLGMLFKINPYNQPAIELSKQFTKFLLNE